MKSASPLPSILVVGPLPPPRYGMSVFTESLLGSVLATEARIVHVDTSDHRDVGNIGTVDMRNLLLAVLHGGRFLRVLTREAPDVVYLPLAQNVPGVLRDLLFLLPAKWLRKRVVVHFHGSRFDDFRRDTPRLLRRVLDYALSDVVLVVVLADRFAGEFRRVLRRGQVTVVPNGIAQVERDPRPLDAVAGPTLLTLGNMSRDKGTLALLEALPAVREEFPGLRVVLGGEWSDRADQAIGERIVRSEGLGSIVQFEGHYGPEALPRLLGSADVLVHPSFHEGQGLIVLEAMSAGVPVVASAVGGIVDTVVDGATGVLVPPGDVGALAAALTAVLSDQERLERMGREGYRRWSDYYTLEHWGRTLTDVLLEVAK